MKTIADIKRRYYSIARRLKAPAAHVQFATTPQHDGSPHVELEGKSYCYVITERGQEFERRRTTDPDEVLYWLVSDVTRAMASDHELRNRAKRDDFRRLLFKKHLELLADVSNEWSQRKKMEYDRVLAEHPFRDAEG